MRRDSIISRTLYSSRQTGSVGWCTEPPMFSLTAASVSSSTMLRASVKDRASRSSFVTTRECRRTGTLRRPRASAVNQVISKRMVKKQQMRWSPRGAHLLLQIRTRVLNDTLADDYRRWYPRLHPTTDQDHLAP
jgi:hypothetical protein